jgi:hypothetical protein
MTSAPRIASHTAGAHAAGRAAASARDGRRRAIAVSPLSTRPSSARDERHARW